METQTKKHSILKEYKLTYCGQKEVPTKRIIKPSDTYSVASCFYDDGTIQVFEQAFCIYVNSAQDLKGFQKLGEGNNINTIVDIKRLVSGALDTLASGVILVHNHPSGDPSPSKRDMELTKNVSEACKIFGLELCDHVILTNEYFFSFAENGLLC